MRGGRKSNEEVQERWRRRRRREDGLRNSINKAQKELKRAREKHYNKEE